MAAFNGKEGHWVTTKDGKHLFIKEDLVDKQEREINEAKEKQKALNDEHKVQDDPVKTNPYYRGLAEEAKKVLAMPEKDFEQLNDKSTALYNLMSKFADAKVAKGELYDALQKANRKIDAEIHMGYVNTGRYDDEVKKSAKRKGQIDYLEGSIWKGSGKATSPKDIKVGDIVDSDQYEFTDQRLAPFVKKGRWKGDYYGVAVVGNGDFSIRVTKVTPGKTTTEITGEKLGGAPMTMTKKIPNSVYLRTFGFPEQIKSVREMPEKSLSEITRKNEAYIRVINAMKKAGYQGSDDKDYNAVIDEFAKLTVREGDLKRAKKKG